MPPAVWRGARGGLGLLRRGCAYSPTDSSWVGAAPAAAGASRRERYFSAPAVSPCTTWRWKMMYAARTGSMAITRPAKRPDQSPL